MRLKALLVSAAVLAGSLICAQSPVKTNALPPTRDQFLTTLSGYLDALRIQAGIPGMTAAIVGDTDLIWAQAFGLRDIASAETLRADTPFHFDGLTQLITTAMLLQCVDQGTLTLDTPIGTFTPSTAFANSTVAQILTQTTGTAGNLRYAYNGERLELLKFPIETCSRLTFRQAFTKTLQRAGMMDSVPGPDAPRPDLSNADVVSAADAARYQQILFRLPTPYAVSSTNVPSITSYSTTTLGAAYGLVSTVYDFAKFDVALRNGQLGIRPQTLLRAWSNPLNAAGEGLPHGMGWFVQSYNGEPVVWQFGIQPAISSSLVVTLPARNITLLLLANSDGLAKPTTLLGGDVTVSPFARVFLGLVVK